MRKLALLFSPTDRPRLMQASDMEQIICDDDSKTIVITPFDASIAAKTGIAVVSIGSLKKSMEENERSHYIALSLGAVCIKHSNFITDIEMNSLLLTAVRDVTFGACTTFAMQVGSHLSDSEMRDLCLEVFQRATALVDCPCVIEHYQTVANLDVSEPTDKHRELRN